MATIAKAELDNIKKTLCEHDEFINGNGKQGAKARLDVMDEQMETIDEKLDSILGILKGIAISAGGGLILWIATVVFPRIFSAK